MSSEPVAMRSELMAISSRLAPVAMLLSIDGSPQTRRCAQQADRSALRGGMPVSPHASGLVNGHSVNVDEQVGRSARAGLPGDGMWTITFAPVQVVSPRGQSTARSRAGLPRQTVNSPRAHGTRPSADIRVAAEASEVIHAVRQLMPTRGTLGSTHSVGRLGGRTARLRVRSDAVR
jgi:hypothetical protein